MKSTFRNLLGVLGVAVCGALFSGCDSEADEAKADSKQETNSTGTSATPVTTAGTTNNSNTDPASTEVKAPAGTTPTLEPPLVAAELTTNTLPGTNALAAQQTTIINAIPPTLPPNLNLSKGVQEVVKLAQSGVSETVILLYVEKFPGPFELDAADLVYLNDIGVSSTVLAAMLNHDGADASQLDNVLSNKVEVATAPAPQSPPTNMVAEPAPVAVAPPQYEVSSNYVAAAPGGQIAPQPAVVEQQPVVVQQQPIVVQQPVVMAQPQVTYSYFYPSLAPYGGWVYLADYGWCWQPTVAVTYSGWRPYCHGGRWLYSDAGWYWHSDYSWGWAPFHYGRWYCAPRYGWVWTPDYVWGPSWVTWRRSSDYCGWAPLPPRCHVRPGVGFSYWDRNVGFSFNFGLSYDHYTFIPTRHFAGRHVIDHVVPTERTVNIYKDSVVVNNYYLGNNHTIVNQGISRDYVASHTRSEIPRVNIREENRGNRVIPADRLHRAGNELVVYRPPSPPAQAEAALRATRERVRPSIAGPSTASGLTASPSSHLQTAVESRHGVASTPAARSEVSRPQLQANLRTPAYATPAPLRPETQPSPTVARPGRIESRNLSGTSSGSRPGPVSSGLLSTASSGRPQVLNPAPQSVTPQAQTPGVPAVRSPFAVVESRPAINANPGTVETRSRLGQPANTTPRSEISRPVPSAPISRYSPPGATATPSTVPGSTPGIRPNAPATIPGSRFGTPAPNSSPAIAPSRPLSPVTRQSPFSSPSISQPAAPARSPDLVAPRQESIRPQPNLSSIPRYSPQPNVSIAPQPITPRVPVTQSFPQVGSPVQRAPIGRNEGFSGGRPFTAPVQRPEISASSVPRYSPPAAPSFPTRTEAPRVEVSSRPIGGAVQSSAPPAVAPRPNVLHSGGGGGRAGSPQGGRGRVEVGR